MCGALHDKESQQQCETVLRETCVYKWVVCVRAAVWGDVCEKE